MELSDSTCIIIPTYNNEKTIRSVVESVLPYSRHVIVVNDGSTDATTSILQEMQDKIMLVSYAPNKGKGFALKQAFAEAKKHNFTHAVTLDADGQHKATDLPLFAQAIADNNSALIIGSRQFDLPNMPSKNESVSADSAEPKTSGNIRATASTITIAGNSPPVRT